VIKKELKNHDFNCSCEGRELCKIEIDCHDFPIYCPDEAFLSLQIEYNCKSGQIQCNIFFFFHNLFN
jgi:hypothetical protein